MRKKAKYKRMALKLLAAQPTSSTTTTADDGVDPDEEDETDKVDPEATKGTIYQQFENEMFN